MKSTIGIDIIEVDRIEQMIIEYNNSFLNRIFTINEIAYCEKSYAHKYEKYAARFAAKEAVFKSLNVKDVTNVKWTDIEIFNEDTGRPLVKLSGELAKYIEKIDNVDISLSHIKDTAIANVVVNWKEN